MSAPLAVLPSPECQTGELASSAKDTPGATWKFGILVLHGLPDGPAAWALRTPAGRMLLRGWVSAESGRAAVQLPFADSTFVLEIRSGSNHWNVEVPQQRT